MRRPNGAAPPWWRIAGRSPGPGSRGTHLGPWRRRRRLRGANAPSPPRTRTRRGTHGTMGGAGATAAAPRPCSQPPPGPAHSLPRARAVLTNERAKRTAPPSGRTSHQPSGSRTSLTRPLRTVPCPAPLPGSQRGGLMIPRPRIHPHLVTPGVPRTQFTPTSASPGTPTTQRGRTTRGFHSLPPSSRHIQSLNALLPRRPLQTAAFRILDAF